MKKEDLRVLRTRKLLFTALLELLEQPKATLRDITVQQICDLAMVHRSTFYMHYKDKYDLFFSEFHRLEEKKTLDERKLRLMHPISMLEKNTLKDLFGEILRKNIEDPYFFHLLQASVKQQIKKDIMLFSNQQISSRIPLEIIAEFYSSTITTLNIWWIKNGKNIPAEKMDEYFWLLINQNLLGLT